LAVAVSWRRESPESSSTNRRPSAPRSTDGPSPTSNLLPGVHGCLEDALAITDRVENPAAGSENQLRQARRAADRSASITLPRGSPRPVAPNPAASLSDWGTTPRRPSDSPRRANRASWRARVGVETCSARRRSCTCGCAGPRSVRRHLAGAGAVGFAGRELEVRLGRAPTCCAAPAVASARSRPRICGLEPRR